MFFLCFIYTFSNTSIPLQKMKRQFTETEKYRNNLRKMTPASKLKFEKLEKNIRNRSFTANNCSGVRDISNISKTEENKPKKYRIGAALNTTSSSPKSKRN
jgi:hypothetical protein